MCGGYPLGAQYDPRAPYNQPDPVEVECPDCGGTGYAEEPYALDLDGNEVKVTEAAWQCLPETETLARQLGQRYYRAPREECETCNGTGRVEVEPADLDDFDELEAEERYYERKYGSN